MEKKAMDIEQTFICPYCKGKQDYLSLVESGYFTYDFTLDNEGDTELTNVGFDSDGNVTEFKCVSCRRVITTNWNDAVKIMKGEMQPEKDKVTIY